jgi:hypothetical protein
MEAGSLESSYLLSAIVEQRDAPELRTTAYSRNQLSAFLEDDPAAITLAPPGSGNAERLLHLFLVDTEVFQPLLEAHHPSDPWLLFAEDADQLQLEQTVKHDEQLVRSVLRVVHRRGGQSIVMIRQTATLQTRFDALLKALRRVIDSPSSRAARGAPISTAPVHEESDRAELMRIRKEMLEQAGGTFDSEDLATAAKSVTTNSSQLGADQRGSGKLFGVRWGREWRYPKFQFDSGRQLYPEMKSVLSALSPDQQGWDRLQWFLHPHERLNGRTPLQVWKSDRQIVIEAALSERWDGRD